MDVTINGRLSPDPKDRILAIEAVMQSICQRFGQDPADGTMMLLTAAVHMASRHSGRPIQTLAPVLAECLGAAIVAADDFFKLKAVANDQ